MVVGAPSMHHAREYKGSHKLKYVKPNETIREIYNSMRNFRNAYENMGDDIGMARQVIYLSPKHPHMGLALYSKEVIEAMKTFISSGIYNVAVILDMKNLKKVNELDGTKNHYLGDIYMEVASEILRRHFRKEDHIGAMWGSDEILLLMNIDPEYKNEIEKIIYKRILEEVNPKVEDKYKERLYLEGYGGLISKIDFPLGFTVKVVYIDENTNIEDLRKINITKDPYPTLN